MISKPNVLAAAIAGLVVGTAQAQTSDQPVRLQSTVVSAAGFEQDLVEAPASITVITRAQLEQQQVRHLGDALRDIVGVNVDERDARSNKTGNQSISLRGLPSRYTLILIDGRRQNSPGTVSPNAFDDTSSVFIPPVAAIERIEVIRGPMSTLYGSDALGGVVNIITRKAGNEWSGGVSIEGTFQGDNDFPDSQALSAYAGGALVPDLLKLQAYARTWHRESGDVTWPGQSTRPGDLRTMGQNPVRADSDTAGARLTLTPNQQHEIMLAYDATRQTYDNRRGQLGRIDGSGRGYDTELGFDRDQYTLGHTWRLDFGTLDSSLMRNRTETDGRLIPSGTPGRVVDADRELVGTNTLFDTKLVAPVANHMISVGGQWWDARLRDGIAPGSYTNSQWGVFVEDEWRLRDDFALTGGLRYDRHDEFGGEVTPRVYAVWNTTDNWTLKGGVGRGYKTPWLEELAPGIIGYGSGGTVPLFGNPDLKPEKTVNTEIAALYDSFEGFSAQVTVFHTRARDLIERPTGATNLQFDNIGRANIDGVELAASIDLAQDWRLSGNYTFTDSEIRSGARRGDPLTDTPRHMVNARLTWQATPQLSTFAGMEYRGTAYRDPSFHEPSDGGNAQGAKAALGDFRSYSQFSLGGTLRVTENIDLNAAVLNLTNKDFNDYRPYLREDNQQLTFSNVYNHIHEPRRLWVSMDVRF